MNKTYLITRGVPLVIVGFLIVTSIVLTKTYNSDSNVYGNEAFSQDDERVTALEEFNADRIVKVSYNNPLWQVKNERSLGKANQLIAELQTISQVPVIDYERIFDKYVEKIGINGMISAIVEATEKMETSIQARLSHYIGNYAVMKATKLRDAMEVVIETPEMPTSAPLHGAVMEAMVRKNETRNDVIFDFIDNDVCFMKNLENADEIYKNCIHGVGHGIQLLFKDYEKTTKICSFYKKGELAYSCGGGIFMADSQTLNEIMTGCSGITKFAPTCYRVLRRIYGKYLDLTCNWIEDPYHKRACYWGLAQNSKNATYCRLVIDNENDYLTCIDGIISDSPMLAHDCDFLTEGLSVGVVAKMKKLCELRATPEYAHVRYTPWVLNWFEEVSPDPMIFEEPSPLD